jgi:hypothetical protein
MNKNIYTSLSKILKYESKKFIPNLHTNSLSYWFALETPSQKFPILPSYEFNKFASS